MDWHRPVPRFVTSGGGLYCPACDEIIESCSVSVDLFDDGGDSTRWYRTARMRWRGVDWPFARYRRHLGDDRPSHPEDLYLGGAAGERVSSAWTGLYDECRSPVIDRLHASPRGGMSSDDLWAEAVVRLMSDSKECGLLPDGRRPARIIRFRGRSSLRTYLYVTALRVGLDAHRRRQGRPATEGLDAMPSEPDRRREVGGLERDPSPSSLDDEARRFTEVLLSLSSRKRALLALVHGRGMPKSRAGSMLGCAPYTVSRELKLAIGELRERLQISQDEAWPRIRIDAWLRAWTHAAAGIFEDGPFFEESGDDA